jgi:hypothetical protein
MVTNIWKVNIKGNSMDGLFPDGQTYRAKVWTDFTAASDIHIGRIVILKKRRTLSRPSIPETEMSETEMPITGSSETEKPILIIHRIVGRFCFKGQLSFWEKGDNDYFPKVCYPEEIASIVTGIEDHPEFSEKLRPDLWQERNRNLIKFYQAVGRVYALIEDGRGDRRQEIFYKVWRKGFWFTFYFFCSSFNLKGH